MWQSQVQYCCYVSVSDAPSEECAVKERCFIWRYVTLDCIVKAKSLTLHKYKDWILWADDAGLICVVCKCIVSTAVEHEKCVVLENSSLALMVFHQALLTRHTAHAWSPLACRTSPWPAEMGNRHTALCCGPGSSPSHRWPCDCSGGPTNWERVWKKEMEGKKTLKRKKCLHGFRDSLLYEKHHNCHQSSLLLH